MSPVVLHHSTPDPTTSLANATSVASRIRRQSERAQLARLYAALLGKFYGRDRHREVGRLRRVALSAAMAQAERVKGPAGEPDGFANSGGLVFVDESAEQVAAA